MTVKEFMESQINHFASQIREKATTLTRKMRSDFEASKLDYMEQLDTAKEQLEQEQINNQATNSDLATETTEINGDTTTDSMKTSSTSSSSSTSKPNAPSTTSSSTLPPAPSCPLSPIFSHYLYRIRVQVRPQMVASSWKWMRGQTRMRGCPAHTVLQPLILMYAAVTNLPHVYR